MLKTRLQGCNAAFFGIGMTATLVRQANTVRRIPTRRGGAICSARSWD